MAQAERPINLEHLDTYTGGDPAINREILEMFAQQCRNSLAQLIAMAATEAADSAWDKRAWFELMHTLKGAARGVGAFALGEAAAEAEKAGEDRVSARGSLGRLQSDASDVQGFIAEFLKSPA
jgi:HPt (histidine-containing phosphotransfer) domain-containing protein